MKSPLLYAGLFLVFALFTALLVPFFVDWSDYRADIEAYGERITGRKVTVGGNISVRFLPAPVLRVENIRVSNPPDAGSENLFVARSVQAKLSLAPLLRGKIDVSSVDVESPVIELELLKDGATWDLKPVGGFNQLLAADDVRLDDTRINSGTLVLRDRSRGLETRLEKLNVTLSAPSLGGPYKASGVFSHEGASREFRVSVGKHKQGQPLRLAVTLTPEDRKGKRLNFDGVLTKRDVLPIFEGRFRLTEIQAESDADGKGDRSVAGLAAAVPFEIRSAISANLDEMTFSDTQFILGRGGKKATLSGSAQLDLGDTPNLSAKLTARRLDLDSLVQKKSNGDGVEDPIGTREVLEQIPRLLDFVPKTLGGELTIDVSGLVLGGQQIEGAGVTLQFSPDKLSVSRAVGRLPGQSELSITGTYDPKRTDVLFDGIFALQARDAKSFISWAAPRTMPFINPQAGGARGKLSLKGELKVADHLVELIGVEAKLDKTNARLGLSYALTERPSFGLRVIMDELNVDRYLPPTNRKASPKPDAGEDSPEGDAKSEDDGDGAEDAQESAVAILDEFDANIIAKAEKVIINGTSIRGISLDTTLRGGDLTIKNMTFRDFGGANIAIGGTLKDVTENPEGSLTTQVSAQDPTNLLALFNIGPRGLDRGRSWVDWASLWGPTNLSATFDAIPSGDGAEFKFKADGTFGQSSAIVEGTYLGSLTSIDEAKLELLAELANNQGEELFRQIGLSQGVTPQARDQPGVLRTQIKGNLKDGLKINAGIEAFGAQLAANGTARRVAGLTSLEGEMNVSAKEGGPLYRVLGVLPQESSQQPQGPINLRALVAGKDGEFVVTGLTGSLNDIPVDVNGIFNFNDTVPSVRLNANLAEFSMPWALNVLFHRDSGGLDDTVAQATSLVDESNESDNVWAVKPFGDRLFKRFRLDLKAQVARLFLADQAVVSQAVLEANIADGKATLTSLKGRAFDGEIDISAAMTARRDQISFTSNYALEKAQLGAIAGQNKDDSLVGGLVSSKGELRGQGRNTLALLSSMSGSGTLAVEKGVLRNFDADAFSAALEKVRTEEQIDEITTTVMTGGETGFNQVATEFTINNGVAEFEPVKIASQAISGTARLKIDLPSWQYDSDWRLQLEKYPNAPPLKMVLEGRVGEMSRAFDNQDLKSFLTVKVLQEDMVKLEEQERRARELLAKDQAALEALEKATKERAERERKAKEKAAKEKAAKEKAEREKEARNRAAGADTTAEPVTPSGSGLDSPVLPPGANGTIDEIEDFLKNAEEDPVDGETPDINADANVLSSQEDWFQDVEARGFDDIQSQLGPAVE